MSDSLENLGKGDIKGKSSEVMTILSATLVTSHILIDQLGTFLRFTFSVGRSKKLHLLENTIRHILVTA